MRGSRSAFRPPSRSASPLRSLRVKRWGSLRSAEAWAVSGWSAPAPRAASQAVASPASHTSTPRRDSCLAMASFSGVFSVAPGLCSPSLSVVSKMTSFSLAASVDIIDRRTKVALAAACGRERAAPCRNTRIMAAAAFSLVEEVDSLYAEPAARLQIAPPPPGRCYPPCIECRPVHCPSPRRVERPHRPSNPSLLRVAPPRPLRSQACRLLPMPDRVPRTALSRAESGPPARPTSPRCSHLGRRL
jgi:hypothetical protein